MFEIKSVAVDPVNPSIVYAGNSDSQFSLFRSTDGGATWTSRSTNLSAGTVNAIAIDPANPSTIYLGSPVGVWKSVDAGATWVNSSNGIGQPDVVRLAIDRTTPSTLYALTMLNGVFKSTNGGASWTPASSGLVITGNSITLGAGSAGLSIDPTTPSRIYVANYVSTNGGASWTAIPTLDGTITGHAFSGSTIYASSQIGGVYRSTDSGQTWAKTATGLPAGSVWSVAVDPKNGQVVYATTDSGIYKSVNGGASWAAVNKGVSNTDVTAVVVDPFAPANVFAGTSSNGIFRSSDSGSTWTSVHAGSPATTRIMGMAVDPQTPATVYAANWFGSVFRSTDRGATWTSATASDDKLVSIAVDPVNPSTVYVGTLGRGVAKSTDRGTTFTVVNAGMPRRDDNAAVFGTVTGIAVSPRDQSVWAWVQTGDASYVASISRDGGATWSSSYPGWNPTPANAGPALLDFLTNTVGLKNVSANFVNKQYGGPPFCLPITQVIADPFDATVGYASGGCGVGRAKLANGQLSAMALPARLPDVPVCQCARDHADRQRPLCRNAVGRRLQAHARYRATRGRVLPRVPRPLFHHRRSDRAGRGRLRRGRALLPDRRRVQGRRDDAGVPLLRQHQHQSGNRRVLRSDVALLHGGCAGMRGTEGAVRRRISSRGASRATIS